MKLVVPITVDVDNLTTTNVAITETEWTAGTYNTGDQRYIDETLYEVSATPSTTDDPITGIAADPPTWFVVGAINRFKMFDAKLGSQTENANNIDVTITPLSVISAVGFFETDASTIQVIMTDYADGVVYDQTVSLVDLSGITDWWLWFFAPVINTRSAFFGDLPSYANAEVRAIIDAGSGTAKCGEMALGFQYEIGLTSHNARFRIKDYSVKQTDAFGNVSILERRSAKLSDFEVTIAFDTVDFVRDLLDDNRARAVIWSGSDGRSETLLYGFYNDFEISTAAGNSVSNLSLKLESLA